jgi:RNA polymerase sigma-70 factor (TIGR02954 family)
LNIDLQIVHKAINGNDEAFLSLIHFYKTDLYKTSLAYLGNVEDSVEAIQEVTFRAYRSIHTLKEPAYAKTWLIRIMINYCNDQLKRKKRMVIDDDWINKQADSINHSRLELREAIMALDSRSREILILKYFHDLKIKEIAEIIKRPEGTVKTWLNKALKVLRKN